MHRDFPLQLPPIAFEPALVSAVLTLEGLPAPFEVLLSVRLSGLNLLYHIQNILYQVRVVSRFARIHRSQVELPRSLHRFCNDFYDVSDQRT